MMVLDRRWSRPFTIIREVLFSHPQTGEPILVTGLEFRANVAHPPKKTKKPKESMEFKGVDDLRWSY